MNTDDTRFGENAEAPSSPDTWPTAPPPDAPLPDAPLPLCDYTGVDDVPCEEPAKVRRFSGAAVIAAAGAGSIAGGVLVAAALVWTLGLVPGTDAPLSESEERAPKRDTVQQVSIDASGPVSSVVAVAAKLTPSVVNVTVERRVVNGYTGETGFREAGNGSGVIIRADGYILTNNHVVEGADRVLVKIGVEDVVAEVVGADPSTDLAVIKVDRSGLTPAEFGDSTNLQVGEPVVAVGSPFGLERSVTSGIVSALGRSNFSAESGSIATYTNLIQTDAAINPGNSGGALADEEGRVIGINTLIEATVGQSAGIGFAIPIDFARTVADQLISTGRATHPFMGVSSASVDRAIAQQYDLPVESGALVQVVQPLSPAEKAGIRRGDIIVRIEDTEITGAEDVFVNVRAHKVGDTISVEVVRGEERKTFQITLASDAERPRR